ncbi:hypothetical protein ABPG77_004453 [Micractinium sp. CCAP 211/92]
MVASGPQYGPSPRRRSPPPPQLLALLTPASVRTSSEQRGTVLEELRHKLAGIASAGAEARLARAVATPSPCPPPCRLRCDSRDYGDLPALAPDTPTACATAPSQRPCGPTADTHVRLVFAWQLQRHLLACLPVEDQAEIHLARRFLAQF